MEKHEKRDEKKPHRIVREKLVKNGKFEVGRTIVVIPLKLGCLSRLLLSLLQKKAARTTTEIRYSSPLTNLCKKKYIAQ